MKKEKFDFIEAVKSYFNIQAFQEIIPWIEKNINLSDDVSSQRNRPDFSQYPYQVDILKQWQDTNSRKRVTVVACEQMGKSTMWVYGLLYRFVYDPCQSLIVYPSDSKASETNETKLQPLMYHIPGLKEEIVKPRAKRADRYKFSNLVSYFQGSGAKIVSKSCKIVVGDEVDQWNTEHPQNLRDLFKRTRSYDSAMEFVVCSPTVQNGHIWQEFLKGSQGFYTLRCKKCGELTMRSCDIHNLQFESTYNEQLRTYLVKKGSERLICPKCGFSHTEDMKADIIRNGAYVHLLPELMDEHPSYQIGALASQLPSLSWSEIANAQLESGKTSDISIQQNFDNSWRGLPFIPRKITKSDIESLRQRHIWHTPPSLDNVEMIFVTSDTMDDFSSYGVFAFDTFDNLYLIEAGEVPYLYLDDEKRAALNKEASENGKPPVVTLDDVLHKDYLVRDGVGIKPTFMVIDQGGHRGEDVKYFAKKNPNVMMQKGTNLTSCNWRQSENVQRLMLVNEKFYKTSAIFYLYTQKKSMPVENFLYISPEISDESMAQIRDMVPDKSSKWGDIPENWISKTGNDHLFDCLKYAYFAYDFIISTFNRNRFRFCKSPKLQRRFEGNKMTIEIHHQQEQTKNSWFNV